MKTFIFNAVADCCLVDEIIEVQAETLEDAEEEAHEIAREIFEYVVTFAGEED